MKQKLVDYPDSINRTPFYEACEIIFKTLVEQQKPYSITGLARESRLHRKTVEKCINLLWNLEQNWLENYRLRLQSIDNNRKLIALERRTGLLSYPEDIQKLIIKAEHFPLPSQEAYVLVNLYLNNAVSSDNAIRLIERQEEKREILKKLLKQGQIKEKENSYFYLTDEGITVAKRYT